MNSFRDDGIRRQPLSHGLLNTLTQVAEYRGKQELWKRQSSQTLDRLLEGALIASTVASNRIEGVVASPERVQLVLFEGEQPRTRSEQELAGYRQVLQTIHAHHREMRVSPNLVLQLHRDLFQFTEMDAGRWKSVDNLITQRTADGETTLRFQPTPAWQTPDAMRQLHEDFDRELGLGEVNPVLLISAYVLDFLCIHPFLDGNGRVSRLLTLLLLYQSGYEVGKWISLERRIEETQDRYYASLQASSKEWSTAEHSLVPWWEYFAQLMLIPAYTLLEARVGDLAAEWGAKGKAVEAAVRMVGPVFRIAEVEALLMGVSRPTIERALAHMKTAGRIEPIGRGRGAQWRKLT